MAEHGVDGAFLQRFAGQTDLDAGNGGIRRIRDEVEYGYSASCTHCPLPISIPDIYSAST